MMRRLPPTDFSSSSVMLPLESLTIMLVAPLALTTALKVGIPPVKTTPLEIVSELLIVPSPLVSSTAY